MSKKSIEKKGRFEIELFQSDESRRKSNNSIFVVLFLASTFSMSDSISSLSNEFDQTNIQDRSISNENIVQTDSSSYLSVKEQLSSTSTSSYYTPPDSQRRSTNDYETATLQIQKSDDDRTLSSASSTTNLTLADTLEVTTNNGELFLSHFLVNGST